jgi:hypothetical protein
MKQPAYQPGSRQTPIIAAPVAEAGTWASPGAVIAPNQPPEAFRLTIPHPYPWVIGGIVHGVSQTSPWAAGASSAAPRR